MSKYTRGRGTGTRKGRRSRAIRQGQAGTLIAFSLVEDAADGQNCKRDEEDATHEGHGLLRNARRQQTAAHYGQPRAQGVSNDATNDDAAHVARGGKGNRGNLTAISPLGEGSHREGFDKDGGEEGDEPAQLFRPRRCKILLAVGVVVAQLLLHLCKLAYLGGGIGAHAPPVAQELDAEVGEEGGGGHAGPRLVQEEGEGLADGGRQDGHGGEGKEGTAPHGPAGGLHGEDGGDKKGAVADFAGDDEKEGLEKGREKAGGGRHGDLHGGREVSHEATHVDVGV